MEIKTGLLAGSALLLITAGSAFADGALPNSKERCVEGKTCSASPGPTVVEQPAYPFPAPKTAPTDPELDKSREGIVKDNLSGMLGPADIGAVNNRKLDALGASVYPGYAGAPLPAARRLDIDYKLGKDQGPQELWLAQNVPSPIVFQDKYGNPWPIASITYNPKVYSINGQGCDQNTNPKTEPDTRPSTITVNVCKFWTWGTFTVQLQGVNIPVVFVAGSGKDDRKPSIDVPIVVNIDGKSPTGKVGPTARKRTGAPKRKIQKVRDSAPTSEKQAFLNLMPPSGAAPIRTSDGQARAWFYGGSVYFVAPYTVVTPAYEDRGSNPDNGLHLYRFARTISRVYVRDNNGHERPIFVGN